jgi:hypothetical protein
MQKFLLLSILLATVVVPMLTARDTSPRRGLRRTLLLMVLFNAVYLFSIVYILPRLPS